jgi:hypothetical protein
MAGEIAALRKARSNTSAPKLTKSQEVVAMFVPYIFWRLLLEPQDPQCGLIFR